MRILIVEESATVARAITRIFQDCSPDADVSVAGDGEDGLVQLREAPDDKRFELVVLDLKLPGCGGLDVLAAMRTDGRLSATPVIVLSGSTDPADIAACYELQANCFVSRPITPESLALTAAAIEDFWSARVASPDGERVLNRVATVLDGEPVSIGTARRLVVGALKMWGLDDLVEDARLVTSELVTNAILHAGSDVGIAVLELERCVRIEVHDDDPSTAQLRPKQVSDEDLGGRGLALIDQTTLAWGVETARGGKTVWCELRRPRDDD